MTPLPAHKDLEKIKKLYPTMPDKQIADKFGVTEKYVRNVGGRYKLKKNYHWSKAETKIVVKYYEFGINFVNEKLVEKGFIERSKWSIINLYRETTGKKTSSRNPKK